MVVKLLFSVKKQENIKRNESKDQFYWVCVWTRAWVGMVLWHHCTPLLVIPSCQLCLFPLLMVTEVCAADKRYHIQILRPRRLSKNIYHSESRGDSDFSYTYCWPTTLKVSLLLLLVLHVLYWHSFRRLSGHLNQLCPKMSSGRM